MRSSCISSNFTASTTTRVSEEQEVVPLDLVSKGYGTVRQLLFTFMTLQLAIDTHVGLLAWL